MARLRLRRSQLVLVSAALAAALLALAAVALAADRGTIVFQANRFDGSRNVTKSVYAMNPDGSGVKRLEEGLQPSISRDGKTIAFVEAVGEKDERSAEIFVMDADGRHVRQVTNDKSVDSEPALSPNGGQIAFVGDRRADPKPGEPAHIFSVDVDGSNQRQLTKGRQIDLEPSFSPNGGRLVFIRGPGESQVVTMTTGGADVTQLTKHSDPFSGPSSPSYSNDGQRILFGAFAEGNRIFTIDASDGSDVTPLTRGDSEGLEPAYSPEGGTIVFRRGTNLFAMDASGVDVQQLSELQPLEGSNIHPTWGR